MAQSQNTTREKISEPPNGRIEQTTNRLVTFETDEDERLVVIAGRDEMDNRTIYSGSTAGRYALVPVDDLAGGETDETPSQDLRIEVLRIIGETASVEETGGQRARLSVGGHEVASRDAAGVYGLLWVPSE